MNKIKKFVCLVLCLVICSFALPAVSAAPTTNITITSNTGFPGDTVPVDICITGNPGIMAMTFSVVYDKDNLEFVDYTKGFMVSPTYKDHSDKGYVVFCFAGNSESDKNGVIITLNFKIKKDAELGNYTLNIGNHNYAQAGTDLSNCFSNANEKYIVPSVKKGSITVDQTCDIAGHKFDGWIITQDATCTATGQKKHICSRCNFSEEEVIPSAHVFDEFWTVDKAATPDEDGIMSRHCLRCDAKTDEITFSYDEIVEDDTNDTSSDESSDNSSTDESVSEDSSGENSSGSSVSSDNQSNTSSDSSDKKPVINNTEGAKNPLSEVEKLENYKDAVNSDKPTESSKDETVSSENSSQASPSDKDDTTTIGPDNKADDSNSNSFFTTPLGIILLIISALLSAGIVVLGFLLIRRNNNKQE